MPATVFVTKQFIGDLESLNKSLRKRFERIAGVFCENPFDSQLDTEKLHGGVGQAEVYSCRLNKAYRFIWTNEFSPCSTLRLVGAHDSTYRRAEKMPPLQREKIKDIQEALQGSSTDSKSSVSVEKVEIHPDPHGDVPEEVNLETEVYRCSGDEFQSLLKGNIAAWMLFVTPPHRDFIQRSFAGPARVTGPSGSGKTALLLHRAFHEAKRSKDAQVLVVCFNVALAHVLSKLLDHLCGDDWEERSRINVGHLDRLAMDVCGQPSVTSYKQQMLTEACRRVNPERLKLHFEANTVAFLEKEISVWIKGSPDMSPDAYRNLKFPSSHTQLSQEEREEVVRVAEEYERVKGSSLDWEDLRNMALEKVKSSAVHPFPKVTAVLVDEYQDFSVTALKFIMELGKPAGHNIFFCGDERQRIYGSNSSFRQLGIEVRGRALPLETSYRNTRQIAQVAAHLTIAIEADEADGTVPAERIIFPTLEGPLPVLAGFSQSEGEMEWIAAEIQDLLTKGYLPGEIGVLTPNWTSQNACAALFQTKNLPFFILKGETAKQFFGDDEIKLSTYHQAKGLEYKVVFCTGLSSALFRKEYRYSGVEGKATLASLVYMAVTRARDRLFLSFSGTPLKWLCTLNHGLVELQGNADLLILGGQERLETKELGFQKPVQASLL